ncbi:MAG: hypothetical protein FDZ75_07495 [Actinobacteria bacterium]|nr:MAG: hypothetical protein FDZ75_07495 [Actinomycetota bacterium]
MRGRDIAVAALVGALLGLIAIVVVAFLVRANILTPAKQSQSEHGTLVALVLPAEDGVQVPRVVLYYPPGTAAPTVVDPSVEASVQGTSANRLADAYSFGGGAGLARAYAELEKMPTPVWIVIDAPTWTKLAEKDRYNVTLAQQVDVFNGVDLVSFPTGDVSVNASDTVALLQGADHLVKTERAGVLSAVAVALQDMLAARAAAVSPVTDAKESEYAAWSATLVKRPVPQSDLR